MVMRWMHAMIMVVWATFVGAQRTWDGEGGDGQWSTAVNWSNDQVPGPTDAVVLDHSAVDVGYGIWLPGGDTVVHIWSLHISPSSGKSIHVTLPVTNSSPEAVRLLGMGDVLVLDEGAVLRNASGASSGTPLAVSTDGFFRINNGGHYIHNTERGHTNGLLSRLSAVTGTEEGVFEFDVPGSAAYTISASGRRYGHLIFSAAAAGVSKTYTAAGISPFEIRSILEVRSNAVLSYGANTSQLIVGRDCRVAPQGLLNIANGANASTVILGGNIHNDGTITVTGSATACVLEFAGHTEQSFYSTGSVTGKITFRINNSAGVRLQHPVDWPGNLDLLSGKILTSATNTLTLNPAAQCLGGSPQSFINGPLRKRGEEAFMFPIGTGGIFAPIAIGPGTSPDDVITAQYVRNNPKSQPGLGSSIEPSIEHISSVEYWTLGQSSPGSRRTVRLFATPFSFAQDLSTLLVTRYSEGTWRNEGAAGFEPGNAAPPFQTGSFESSAVIDASGAFTIGTTSPVTINPLPMSKLAFIVHQNGGTNMLDCTIREKEAGMLLDFERSEDGRAFIRLHSCTTTVASNYHWIDTIAKDGFSPVVYYRARLRPLDVYSEIKTAGRPSANDINTTLWPNPVINKLWIDMRTSEPAIVLTVIDIAGNNRLTRKIDIERYAETILCDVSFLKPGSYLLVLTGRHQKKVIRFVKR